MMHLDSSVLLLLFFLGCAHRSVRIDKSLHGVQHQNNALASNLEVSADTRAAFIPGTGVLHRAGPQARAFRSAAPVSRHVPPLAKPAIKMRNPFDDHEPDLFDKNGLMTGGGIAKMVEERPELSDVQSCLDSIYLSNVDVNGLLTDEKYLRAKVQMFASDGTDGEGGTDGTAIDSQAPEAAVLDRPPPETEMDGGGAGSGPGGPGGGDGDSGDGSGEGGGVNRRIVEKDKYAFQGVFAKYIAARIMPVPEGSFLAQIANINLVRDELKGSLNLFMPAYDLQTKRMHFYVMKENLFAGFAEKFKDLTNDDKGLFNSFGTDCDDVIKLNQDTEYVRQNLIKDVKGVGVLNDETQIPEDAVFISYDIVENFVKDKLKGENGGKASIEEVREPAERKTTKVHEPAERKGEEVREPAKRKGEEVREPPKRRRIFGAIRRAFKSVFGCKSKDNSVQRDEA